jgi:ADP-heptose:LPS heptosyltransferase
MEKLKPAEHKFKAFFFLMFSPFLKRGEKEFKPLDGRERRKVLFLRPEKLGDMIISFPVFDGLKKEYPHLRISILASPKSFPIIDGDPRFEKIFLYRKNLWRDFGRILAMRREKYDCVVDMICDDSVTALFLSQLCAPGKPRIGVGKVKFRRYYDFNYDHRMGNTGHIIDNTLKLLEAFGIDSQKVDRYAQPFVDQQSREKAERFIRETAARNPGARMIGYNLSAGSPTRIWGEGKSIELIRRILDFEPKCTVILFTPPNERERGEKILGQFGNAVYLVPDKLNLKEASALIARLDLFISPDTSLVHIARSFQVPVVGLYSRFMKNFLLWRPYGQSEGAVVSGNDDNIHDITVPQVFDVFSHIMQSGLTVRK